MSDQTVEVVTKRTPNEFRGSLVRTIVIMLAVLSLIPVIIIGAVSYFQFQTTLKNQTDTQIASLAQTNSSQMEQSISIIQSSLNALTSSSYLATAIPNAKNNLFYFYNNQSMLNYLGTFITNMSDYDLISIQAVRPDGYIVLSSQDFKAGSLLSHNQSILSLIGQTNKSVLILNPDGNYPGQLILVTAYTKQFVDYPDPLTFLYFSKPTVLTSLLTNPTSYFTSANVFFVTSDKSLVTLNPVSRIPQAIQADQSIKDKIISQASTAGNGREYTYTNYENKRVYSYFRPSNYMTNVSYVIEVPTSIVQDQIRSLLNFILILLGATLLLSITVSIIGGRGIANPLVTLSEKARNFANGDFSQKAVTNRRDEIGLLASSFNYMVDQLSAFYSSLESKVAERTEQLRTVSEIAMDAVSEPNTAAILRRITRSIVEKLGYPYASVYLADKNNEFLVLSEDFSVREETLPDRSLRLPINSTSLPGSAASTRQPRISANVQAEKPKLLETSLLKSTTSEVSLPITIGDRLIGILDIQSDQPAAFDIESMPAFTTLTTQLSNGLRNIELLESTQLSLQETAVLYSATRAISQAVTEEQVLKEIENLFSQTSYSSFFLDSVENGARLVSIGDANPLPTDKSILGTILPFTNAIKKLDAGGMEIVENFQLFSDFSSLNAFFGRRGCHSAAMLPVFEGKQVKHVLAIGSREETPLTSLSLQPYINLTEAIGSSLEKIHLNESLSQKERDLLLLDAVTSETNKEVDLKDAFYAVHDQIRGAFGENIGFSVALFDRSTNTITTSYYFSKESLDIPQYSLGDDLVSQVIKRSETIFLEDATNINQLMINSAALHLSARSYIGIPMLRGQNCIGVISLFTTDRVTDLTKESQIALNLLATQIALIISIAQQKNELSDLTNTYEYEKSLLDTLMENIPDRISFKNDRNEFIRLSSSMAKFLGAANTSELVGKRDEYPYYQTKTDEVAEVIENTVSTQTPVFDQKEQWIDREGNIQWVISNKIPLVSNEGTVNGVLSISNNITDLVKVQQLAEHRADQLLTASDIAQESTAGTMDVEVTLARLVELIKTRFNFYHASVFMIDALGKFAVLRESTGEAGAQMKQRGHKLAVGSPSIVGQATGKGEPVVVGDVTAEENYFANPLLPLTRSEMAIPMKIGEHILGAVDVQSTEYNAFSDDDIAILQILANQAAIAVQNEDLFSHTNESLSRHRLLNQVTSSNVENMTVEDAIRATLQVLHQAMPDDQITYFTYDQEERLIARATAGITSPEQTSRIIRFGKGVVGRVAAEGAAKRIDDVQIEIEPLPQNFETNSILAVPVKFADRLIGVIDIESTNLAEFDENDQEFATTLASNMGSIISNIQLVDQVRSQVNRQQKLLEISSKIRRSVDINTIMQTSVSEIGSSLNVRKATIKILPVFNDKKEEKE